VGIKPDRQPLEVIGGKHRRLRPALGDLRQIKANIYA
jgi:hypothetical protein